METFKANETITELNIDTSRKFIVVDGGGMFNTGDILTLVKDNSTILPLFKRESDGFEYLVSLNRLSYYEEEWKPVRGEKVLVWDNNEEPQERIYLCTIEGSRYPYSVVALCFDDLFLNGEKFNVTCFSYIKQIPKVIPEESPLTSSEIRQLRSLIA